MKHGDFNKHFLTGSVSGLHGPAAAIHSGAARSGGPSHEHDALDGLCCAGGSGASASPPGGLRPSGAPTVKRRSQCLSIQCCNIRSSGKVGTRQIFSLLLYFCSLAQSIVQFVCDSLFDENERILKFISSV